MKKLIISLLFALSACRQPAPEPPSDSVELAQHTLDGTVKIQVGRGHGSGFFVAPGVIMTAAHVVDDLPRLPRVKTRSGRSCFVERGSAMVGHDVALLWVDGCTNLPVLTIGPDPKEGAEIWAAGAPLDAEWSITRGIVADADHETHGSRHLVLDAVAHGGMSGGPVVDSQGRAVGVTVMIFSGGGGAWGGKTLAVPILDVVGFLKVNNVKYSR